MRWVCNLPAIAANLKDIMGFQVRKKYTGNLLLLLGEKSYHFDRTVYEHAFPELRDESIVMVEGAGHWVHADRPKTTVREIARFLDSIDGSP